MPKRIYEQYAPGETVEVTFSDLVAKQWQPARVLALEPPGIWVQTTDGARWFMTNTYRIRKKEETTDCTDSTE